MNSLSTSAARALRGGNLPHIPPRASAAGTSIQLELEAPDGSEPVVVLTDTRRALTWRVALTGAGDRWACDLLLPAEPTVLSYFFVLNDGRVIQERRQFEGLVRPLFGDWQTKDFRIAVYDPASAPPAWTRGAVIYQIFPDRFAIGDPDRKFAKPGRVYGREPRYPDWAELPKRPAFSNEFYGGDLPGVTGKLDYLQSLGVSCIYFTPLFDSPTNHRYDAADYHKIDPRLGNEDDLRDLIAQAKARGIRVLLDGVFNHCSSDSLYFKQAKADKTSPWFRCFEFVEWKRVYPPQTPPGAPWTHMMQYPLWPRHSGWAEEPSMPEWVECPEMEAFFLGEGGVVRHWMRTGIAGWRTDVTPWQTDAFWRRFRTAVRAIDPEAFLIAEDWGDSTPRFLGDTFDATMNYRFGFSVLGFANGQLSPAALDDRLETMRRDYAEPFFQAQLNLIDSHDTARALSELQGDRDRLRLALALQLGYPGVPSIFYGDEAGLSGSNNDEARAPYPWGREDAPLLEYYRTAIQARRASPALSQGDVESAYIDDAGGVYGFWRTHDDEKVLVLLNASPQEQQVELAHGSDFQRIRILLGRAELAVGPGVLRATLPPCSAVWLCGER